MVKKRQSINEKIYFLLVVSSDSDLSVALSFCPIFNDFTWLFSLSNDLLAFERISPVLRSFEFSSISCVSLSTVVSLRQGTRAAATKRLSATTKLNVFTACSFSKGRRSVEICLKTQTCHSYRRQYLEICYFVLDQPFGNIRAYFGCFVAVANDQDVLKQSNSRSKTRQEVRNGKKT
jgi:hypothetical protein